MSSILTSKSSYQTVRAIPHILRTLSPRTAAIHITTPTNKTIKRHFSFEKTQIISSQIPKYGQYIVPKESVSVNFQVGQPAPSLLPLDILRKAAAIKFSEKDPLLLQYGCTRGYPEFRSSLANFLSSENGYGTYVNPEKLFVTNGVSGALSLLCGLLTNHCDTIFAEEPSYFLALKIFKDYRLNVVQVPMDKDGINIEALETKLKSGQIPKFLYTVTTAHNPTGRTLSAKKRKKLVELSNRYNFLIVADEVYQLLTFPHVFPPPPMFTYDKHDTVIGLGSFAKILAPALRLGWIQGPEWLLEDISSCGQLDSSGGMNPVISAIVHAAIDGGYQDNHLIHVKKTLWYRAKNLMKSIDEHLVPLGCRYEVPDGGYFILVTLPDGIRADEVLEQCKAMQPGVQFLPGTSFGDSMQNYIRLSFSYYDPEDLAKGIERIASVVENMQDNVIINKDDKMEVSIDNPNNTEISVAVHGASGRMGGLIVNELQRTDNDFKFSYAGSIIHGGNIPDGTEVVIDVSLPDGVKSILERLSKFSSPPALVVGTTGELPMEYIRNYSKLAPVVVCPNFSIGVPLLLSLTKDAICAIPKNDSWNVAISEIHHTAKVDTPSGTALRLSQEIESTGVSNLGGRSVPCISIRRGDTIGEHTVHISGPGERLELTHKVTRRDVFAIGALRIAEWVAVQPPGIYFK